MKYYLACICILFFGSCKEEKALPKLSNIDKINQITITPFLVDSLNKNRMEKLTDLRKDIGFHCGNFVNQGFVYFKIKIDSNGKYSDVDVPPVDGLNHTMINNCISEYLLKSKLDLGIVREMPDSKYGAVPREKTYTLRVF